MNNVGSAGLPMDREQLGVDSNGHACHGTGHRGFARCHDFLVVLNYQRVLRPVLLGQAAFVLRRLTIRPSLGRLLGL